MEGLVDVSENIQTIPSLPTTNELSICIERSIHRETIDARFRTMN